MKFLDIFAGIGGFRMGFERAGHKCVGFIEIDKHARKAYEAIYDTKGEWFHDDIKTVDSKDIPRADVWIFGFPCQDISVAGKRKGFTGERSSLFFEVTRLLRELAQEKENSSRMPTYIIAENVKGFFSVNRGWDFLVAITELDEIGYDVEWQLLNSKNFGVPQNRERVFIIGHLRGRSTRQVFPIRGKNTKVDCKLAGRLALPGKDQWNRVYDPLGLSPTLTTMQGGRQEPKILVTKKDGRLIKRDIATCLDANYYKGLDCHQQRTGVLEVRPVLTPDREKKRQNGRRMKGPGEPMFTLTAQDLHGIYDGYRIRKLTPRECWRLQGFPDWAFDRAKAAGVSDAQLYKQAGNAVTVNVAYELAKKLTD